MGAVRVTTALVSRRAQSPRSGLLPAPVGLRALGSSAMTVYPVVLAVTLAGMLLATGAGGARQLPAPPPRAEGAP